jgi:hypothetical protein
MSRGCPPGLRPVARRHLLLAALCTPLPPALLAQPTSAPASSIKAAYLYRFVAYVDWPAGAFPQDTSPCVIGVAGDTGLLQELQEVLARRAPARRAVSARAVRQAGELAGVHVLHLGTDADAAVGRAAAGHPILTVGDEDAREETMLKFVLRDGKLRFEARPALAQREGLKLGARLLEVADKVWP